MTLVDTRYWTDKNGICTAEPLKRISSEIRVCCAGGKKLKKPPVAGYDDKKGVVGHALPGVVFPKWTVCPKCKLLHYNPWLDQGIGLFEDPICSNKACNGAKLVQVTWCAASSQGYLDDVPWHNVCHLNSTQKCERDSGKSYLRISADSSGRTIVKCDKCGRSQKINGLKCGVINRPQPWLKFSYSPDFEPVAGDDVKILEVNDPRVYSPQTSNALVIPPESREVARTVYDRIAGSTAILQRIDAIRSSMKRNAEIGRLAKEYGCTKKEMDVALERLSHESEDDGVTGNDFDCKDQSLLRKEYDAFLTPIDDLKEEEDFVIDIKSKAWKQELSSLGDTLEQFVVGRLVDQLVMVKRLREIRIYNGYRRCPNDDNEGEDDQEGRLVSPWVIGEQDWLPAIELYGEGVFFTLDEKLLSLWEKTTAVRLRADKLYEHYEKSPLFIDSLPPIEPRFLLLHIFSHLLMRELEAMAGFPAASLNERIYSSEVHKMAGILIYTAVPDIAGSLGGILECAKPKKFLSLLLNCFRQAAWCSLDPVCSEHEGQGPGLLNRASCHACALVPETACSYSNVFLDRNFIKGNTEAGIPNLQEFVLKNCK
ncbi:hypothetical protein LA52FAK_41170 [Desulforhopalus sp. 52FAK]